MGAKICWATQKRYSILVRDDGNAIASCQGCSSSFGDKRKCWRMILERHDARGSRALRIALAGTSLQASLFYCCREPICPNNLMVYHIGMVGNHSQRKQVLHMLYRWSNADLSSCRMSEEIVDGNTSRDEQKEDENWKHILEDASSFHVLDLLRFFFFPRTFDGGRCCSCACR